MCSSEYDIQKKFDNNKHELYLYLRRILLYLLPTYLWGKTEWQIMTCNLQLKYPDHDSSFSQHIMKTGIT